MKRVNHINRFLLIFFMVIGTAGCSKILQEKPQSGIVPSFFNSPAGVLGGIAGVYNDLRSVWGTEGFSLQSVGGTDETLMGASNSTAPFYTYNNLTTGAMNNGWWNIAYQDINTLNGVLEYGQTVELPEATRLSYLAQAKFLRAFWYYHLVITFGDVPLHTTFITVPSSADSRAPIGEVYAQIIKDLTEAAADLPNTPTAPFLGKAATKPTALYLLGKTYLTRGWSSAGQAGDFTQAYTVLNDLINNRAQYNLDLWPDYADVFKPGPFSVNTNDYGRETLFVSDHSSDQRYGQYTLGGGASGGNAQNLTPWFNRWNYPSNSGINSYKDANTGALVNSGATSMTRDVANGRPYIRIRPNSTNLTTGPNTGKNYFYSQAFSERVYDSRYDKTFQTVWIVNTANISNTAGAANNSRGIGYSMTVGSDTAIWMPDHEITGAPQFDGSRAFKGIIIPPSLHSNSYFPVLKKFDDPFRAASNFNDPSTRPVVIWRFSDVYLLAAEAAFKAGDNVNAAAMINVVRKRAAFRTSYPAGITQAIAEAAMVISPGDVTLDFILDERTREFYGEWLRWWDLVRTNSLLTRVAAWNPVEAGTNIKPFHVLRPIPQDQIDRVTEGPVFPQNPGY
ncbi:RagB/SusD family nutrient uptake outer membrane protein [Pollutibacter soli]|uniref:RagB/SusD family nutrient uptake outer membrane protein n=1 Tax=Pollutibacter soli TaxID=3034157 RepID=UPI003013365B